MNNDNFTDEEDITNVGIDKIEDYLLRRKEYKKLQEAEQIFRFEQFERRNAEIRKTLLFGIMVFVIIGLYYFAAFFALKALEILKDIQNIKFDLVDRAGEAVFTSAIDWHIIFVITSFLIPPTILSFMIIKGVYGLGKTSDTLLGEILTQVKETVENVKGIAEALTPKSKD